MKQPLILLGLAIVLAFSSCGNRKLVKTNSKKIEDLTSLADMMTGTFSSKEQSLKDSLFYDITLAMYPIWEEDKTAKWLYVEQAVTEYIDRPYRQRVYRLSFADNTQIESRVYELPQPERFIHAWDQQTIFDQINPDSLILRKGCSVFLDKENSCYSGSTRENNCSSTLRGANYATSEVKICNNQIVSWDQGWNKDGEQVWGATTEGYIFKRLPKNN